METMIKDTILDMIQSKLDRLRQDDEDQMSAIQWGIFKGKELALEELYRDIMRLEE